METLHYIEQPLKNEDILRELMLINNCISDSKSVVSRMKNNERLCLVTINKKKKKILNNDSQ